MTSEEKDNHKWNCDLRRGDKQCQYITKNGTDGILCCAFREGHPDSLPHETVYNEPTPPNPRVWFLDTEFFKEQRKKSYARYSY